MLISRAPLRVSFAGGGTDLPAFYETADGIVVSGAIDKYVYIFINVVPGRRLQITSSDYQAFYSQDPDQPLTWEGELQVAKAVLDYFELRSGLSVFLASEVPPGTGLGSSSALCVALIKALSTMTGSRMSPREIADLACRIELDMLGAPIGKQDQYASAFGGINRITFSTAGVDVEPLHLDISIPVELARRLMLFYMGNNRSANSILAQQSQLTKKRDPATRSRLDALKEYARIAEQCLVQGALDDLGALIHEGWMQKRGLVAGISNNLIDACYEEARAAGALGGKITGAGGGGFLLLYAPQESQAGVTAALARRGLYRMQFAFDFSGARILVNANRSMKVATA